MKRFTRSESERLVGRRIRTLVRFSGVPEGATGIVIRADSAGRVKIGDRLAEEFDLAIQWDPPESLEAPLAGAESLGASVRAGRLLIDWFTKDEYERYLTDAD